MNALWDWLLGKKNPHARSTKTVKSGYTHAQPSFADLLNIADFDDEHQVFLFGDGKSLGSGFELGDIPAEAAAPTHLQAVFDKIRDTFASVVPLHAVDPWVMQMYVQDEYCLEPVMEHISHSIDEKTLKSPMTQDYLKRLRDLFQKIEVVLKNWTGC